MELYNSIKDYVDTVSSNGITQGTPEWHKAKKGKIGGSSLAMVQGVNTFQKVCDNFDYQEFETSVKMDWGTVFENVIKKVITEKKKVEIMGDRMFIDHSKYTCYSPDGLGIYPINGTPKRALFEFKCPYNRIPKGEVPSYYIPQVKMGLDIIPVADVGVFIEAVFRKCSFEELDFTRRVNGSKTGKKIIACGVIGFHDQSHKGSYVDLGEADESALEVCLRGYCSQDKPISINYSDHIYEGVQEHEVETLKQQMLQKMISQGGLTAILPWKLMRVDIHQVDKELGYLNKWMDRIVEFCDIREQEEPSVKKMLIDKFMKKYGYRGEN